MHMDHLKGYIDWFDIFHLNTSLIRNYWAMPCLDSLVWRLRELRAPKAMYRFKLQWFCWLHYSFDPCLSFLQKSNNVSQSATMLSGFCSLRPSHLLDVWYLWGTGLGICAPSFRNDFWIHIENKLRTFPKTNVTNVWNSRLSNGWSSSLGLGTWQWWCVQVST